MPEILHDYHPTTSTHKCMVHRILLCLTTAIHLLIPTHTCTYVTANVCAYVLLLVYSIMFKNVHTYSWCFYPSTKCVPQLIKYAQYIHQGYDTPVPLHTHAHTSLLINWSTIPLYYCILVSMFICICIILYIHRYIPLYHTCQY